MEGDSCGVISGYFRYYYKKFWWIIILVYYLGSVVPGYSQQFFSFNNNQKSITIPFSLHRNLIIVPVYLNNKGPYNFLLDTGVGQGLITNPNLMDSLNLTKGAQVRITGAGSSSSDLKAFQVPNIQAKLKGVTGKNLTFIILTEDIFNLSTYIGLPVSGILGYQFFNSFVVRVNYVEATLTLYKPETYKQRKSDGVIIPFQLEELKPYLYALTTIEKDKKISAKLIMDTGAGHALSLEQHNNLALKPPEPTLRTQLGTGLSGSINGYMARIQSLQLNKYTFKNVLASFPDHADVGAKVNIGRSGNLGNEILKRFHLVIDYSRSRIALKPNSFYKDKFEHDMSGLDIIATGKTYTQFFISKVEKGSAADEAHIQPGDEILYINAMEARQLSISNIDKLFRSRDGQRLLMILRRDEEIIYRILVLKRRI